MPQLTYLEAIRQAMLEEMERDPRVFVIGEDVGTYGGAFRVTQGFLERFGETRVIDTPISASAIVGASIGAALMGARPIAEMQFIDFISCAFDMLVNYAAKSRYRWGGGVPIVVRGPCGGGVHGGPFHSQNPEAYFLNVPGLKIVAPATAHDAKGLLTAALRDPDPVVVLEPKVLYRSPRGAVPEGEHVVPLGRARIAREGSDVTLVTYGAMVHTCLAAADLLDETAEVVDVRTLKPLDEETILASVARTGRAVVVQEAPRVSGFGAEIAALLAEKAILDLRGPVVRVTGYDVPFPYWSIEHEYLPSAVRVAAAATTVLGY